jgi:outer membrane protein assembly factor BamB
MYAKTEIRSFTAAVMVLLGLSVGVPAAMPPAGSGSQTLAGQILAAAGVKGGLVVHLGCGGGELTAGLHANDSYLVQGLDADEANVARARKHIQSLGLYGKVTAEHLAGQGLPYIDNMVNLVVGEDLGQVGMDEVMRVLAPNGVAYVKGSDGKWSRTVKPRPREMDEWTHYLHDASNNAVAHDSLIEPPVRYQWLGDQRYSRQHDHMSSVSALVSANGRIFYIFDEAPRASILLPSEWKLIARDAFNGTLLWKRDIGPWHEHLWPLKSGPQLMTRRLVAVGDRVYVTLGTDQPLSALDAATGQTVHTYDNTKATEEILHDNGVLFLSVAGPGQPLRSDPKRVYADMAAIKEDVTNPLWTQAPRTIVAVDAGTGRTLWQKKSEVVSESLTADAMRVLFHDGQRIQCLDRSSGQVLWASEPVAKLEGMRSSSGVTLVVHDDVVLYDGLAPAGGAGERSTAMEALSAKDGKLLWKAVHPPCGHMGTPADILVTGGLVWCGAVAQGTDSGVMVGRDLHTGRIISEFPPDVQTHWFHHRCYRAKATDKYLLFSRTGIEFIDTATKHWTCNHWVRGACLYGIMPCNGLVYAPEHPCACYIEAKLSSFSALAGPSKHLQPRTDVPDAERLARGPAYDEPPSPAEAPRGLAAQDWPTYRHDAARSASAGTVVPPERLKQTWQVELGGRLSSPVVADGKLLVASVDSHTVCALDASTGKAVWTFTAGGRVDSPPTIWRGRAIFGSADGCVYCVRASDGQLAWRYRAAPEKWQMGAFGQVESVWPVHGSVLVQNDSVYCVAGRSMFLDGGMRMVRLDGRTGRKLAETILNDRDPATGGNLQDQVRQLNMPVALPDILSSDGKWVYMRSLPFTLDAKRKFVTYEQVKDQQGDDIHLFSPTGFLDDTLWHRTYWVFGRAFASGAGGYYQAGRLVPSGRILAFDDTKVYGYGRLSQYYRWTTPLEFHLFAADKHAAVVQEPMDRKGPAKTAARKKAGGVQAQPGTQFAASWSDNVSVQVTSMVLTNDAMFVAGPEDMENEEQAVKMLDDPATKKKLAEQSAAFEGRRGALLLAVSKADGRQLTAYKLESLPAFDSMIAARGWLYLTTTDGKVIGLGGDEGKPLAVAADLVAPRR